MRGHPSPEVLSDFLAGLDDPAIEAHVEACLQCSDALEGLADPPGALSDALGGVLAGDHALPDRVLARVSRNLSSRQTAEAFFELFGIGVQTARVVLSEGDSP